MGLGGGRGVGERPDSVRQHPPFSDVCRSLLEECGRSMPRFGRDQNKLSGYLPLSGTNIEKFLARARRRGVRGGGGGQGQPLGL